MSTTESCCKFWRGDVSIGSAISEDGSAFENECTPSGGIVLPNGFVKLAKSQSLGGVSSFDLTQDVQRFSIADNSNKRNACSKEIVKGRNISFTLDCFAKSNFEKAFNTKSATRQGQFVSKESVSLCGESFCAGDIAPFAGAPVDLGKPLVLSLFDQQTNASVALIENVDYIRDIAGIEFIKSRVLSSRQVVRANYYTATTVEHESTEQSIKPVSIIFQGDTGNNDCKGNPVKVYAVFFRVLLNMPSGFALLDTEKLFSQLMTGELQHVNINGKRLQYKFFPYVEASH